MIQSESFPLERQQLAQEKPISKKNPMDVYSPFIGPGGILRSTDRIKRSDKIDFDLKHPIKLDGRHPLEVLFLRHMNLKHHHEGVDYLRTLIPQRFAGPKLRSTLPSIRFSCVLCRKRNATPVQHEDGWSSVWTTLVSEAAFHQRGSRLLWTLLSKDRIAQLRKDGASCSRVSRLAPYGLR